MDRVVDPMAIMIRTPGGKVETHIHATDKDSYMTYALVACDFVRHIAKAFHVDEADVWEWVEKERQRPTTPITTLSPLTN